MDLKNVTIPEVKLHRGNANYLVLWATAACFIFVVVYNMATDKAWSPSSAIEAVTSKWKSLVPTKEQTKP